MNVRCPHCASEYVLPERLLGSRGARVRCPRCGQGFVVERGGSGGAETITAIAPEEPPSFETPEPPPPVDPAEAAAQVLDALEERLGARLHAALAECRLWSAHGPELMRAWDAYRDALGPSADADVFRDALRTRWNVDLGSGRNSAGP